MPKVRVHWTLPGDLLEEIAALAAADERSEPFIVEKLLRASIKGDTTSGQARELREAMGAGK